LPLCVPAAYNGSATLNKTFTVDLLDLTSALYKAEAASFSTSISSALHSSNISDEYVGCTVTGFE
jgi:hypothetical protein